MAQELKAEWGRSLPGDLLKRWPRNADGELVIVFNEGDVATMYMGVTEFTIPAEATADIAVPGYLG